MNEFMAGYLTATLVCVFVTGIILVRGETVEEHKVKQSCEVACAPYQAKIKEDSCNCADKRVMSRGWHVAK